MDHLSNIQQADHSLAALDQSVGRVDVLPPLVGDETSGSPSSSVSVSVSSHSERRSVAAETRSGFRKAHSQIVATRQPSARSTSRTALSRATFDPNFACQNFERVTGVVAKRHPSCRCQKHPCTKMTALYFGNTRSGLPGMPLACRR